MQLIEATRFTEREIRLSRFSTPLCTIASMEREAAKSQIAPLGKEC
jgi:hypothetical protein